MTMDIKNNHDALNKAVEYLRANGDDVVFIKRKVHSLSDLKKKNGNEIFDLLSVTPGMKLYKYCSFDKYSENNILNGEVHLRNPNEFDDAFDSTNDGDEYFYINYRLMLYLRVLGCDFNILSNNADLIKLLYVRLGECASNFEEFVRFLTDKGIDKLVSSRLKIIYLSAMLSKTPNGKSIESALSDEFQEFMQNSQKYRISCFTTDPSNLKMWSLYANNNKGICIEYTVPDDFDLLVLAVGYSHKRGDIDFLTAVNDIYDDSDIFSKRMFETVLRKDICWTEQDEYRLIGFENGFKDDQCKFFPITGIYIGNKMGKEDQERVKHICKEIEVFIQNNLSGNKRIIIIDAAFL